MEMYAYLNFVYVSSARVMTNSVKLQVENLFSS